MTEVLWEWVRDVSGIEADGENDFANGYKIGELLSRYKQQLDFPGRFRDTDLIDDQIANFAELQPSLKNLGIKFAPHDAEAIMSKRRGSALRLLYQIKMVLDRVAMTQRPSLPPNCHSDNLIVKDPKMLSRSFRLPKPSADAQESRFFVNRLRAQCAYATLQRREARQNKFEREKLSQQMLAQEMDKVDAEKALEDRETHRKVCLDMIERNRAFMDQWNEQGAVDWKANLARQRHRERLEANYKTRLISRQRQTIRSIKDSKTGEVTRGIADFERNLRKFTSGAAETSSIPLDMQEETEAADNSTANRLDSDSDPDEDDGTTGGDLLVARTTKAGTAKDLMQQLNTQVPAPDVLLKDANEFLSRIKDSKIAGNLARKEREKRRRRFLVDLVREHETEEETYLQEHLLQQLTKPCVEEERINYLVWKTSQYEAIMREGRRQRMKDYDVQRKKDNEVEKGRDLELRDLQVEELFGTVQVNEAKWYRALERGRVARRRAYHVTLVENIVTDPFVDLMNLANAQQELTDKAELDDRLWKNWMDSFVNAEPLEELYAGHTSTAQVRPYQIGPYEDAPKLDFESAALLDGSFKSYLCSLDQWATPSTSSSSPPLSEHRIKTPVPQPPPVAEGDAAEEVEDSTRDAAWKELLSEDELAALPEEYKAKLSPAPDITAGRTTNYRVSTVVKDVIIPPEDPLPDVPLRIVLQGKPMCGKKTVARKLGDEFGLEVLECTSILKQAMNLAGRPQEGTLDALHANAHVPPDPAGNQYLMELQDCGRRAVDLLDEGEVVPPELYVQMIVAKLQSLKTSMSTGWVLCGFPSTLDEMRIFEKALCGYIEPSQREQSESSQRKDVVEYLVPGPSKEPEPFVPEKGGFDMYVLLEASCEAVVLRSAGRRIDLTTNTVYNVADDQQKKPADIKYENLKALDLKQKAQGTFVERMHFFDVHQIETLEFLKLFAPLPEVPRLQVIPEDAPEHVFDGVREKLQMLLQARAPPSSLPPADDEPAVDAELPCGEEQPAGGATAAAVGEGEAGAAEGEDREPAAAAPDDRSAPAPAEQEAAGDTGQPAGADADPEQADTVFTPHTLDSVRALCSKVEHRYLELLHSQWLEIQDPYVEKTKLGLQRYEQHLRESALGVSYLREKFTSFLERKKPEKQTLLNSYVLAYNSWNEEYPRMILDEAPRAEFHLRLQKMRKQFADFRDEKRTETEQFVADIKASGFFEGLFNVVCVLAQHLVSVETGRYHQTCQLLCDFYTLSQGKNLEESKPLPEKIAIATAEDFSARATDEETGEFSFAFVDELKTYASSVLWAIEAPAEQNEDGTLCLDPTDVDYKQALLCERQVFLTRIKQIQAWARRRCDELCQSESGLYGQFRDMQAAREYKEGLVEAKLLQKLHAAVEDCKPVEFRLVLDTTQICEVTNERVIAEKVEEPPKPRVPGVLPEWNAAQMEADVEAFFDH